MKGDHMNIYSKEYDFPRYPGEPSKVICVCFIPRSASNFLAMEMRKTGKLGYPLEYFSYPNTARLGMRFKNKFPSELVRARTSPNGVFSFKWNTSFPYLPFEPDHWLFLDRMDFWAQARSYVVAEKTGEWLKVKNRAYEPPAYEIRERVRVFMDLRDKTLEYLSGKNYLKLWFDDVVTNPEVTVNQILEFCEV
jgi:LPS sulfotransferase NodH